MFAGSVASFGMNLRGSRYRGNWGFNEIAEAAQRSVGDDKDGRRAEFVNLVRRAARLSGSQRPIDVPKSPGLPVPELSIEEALVKATVDGKYRRLLKKIEVPSDVLKYGKFRDFGFWNGTEYAGQTNLLPGYWVYVYPGWYIWGEAKPVQVIEPAIEKSESPAAEKPATPRAP